MKKKFYIWIYRLIGSYLLRYFKDENFETHGVEIFRPTNNNLYDYYSNFIKKFLSEMIIYLHN